MGLIPRCLRRENHFRYGYPDRLRRGSSFWEIEATLVLSLTPQFYTEDRYEFLSKQICMAGNGFLDIICACIFFVT